MSGRRPQPVLGAGQAAAIATVLTGLVVSWLSRRGLLVPDAVAEPIADLIEVGIVAGVGAGASLWAALWARIRVTPTTDPRDADGNPLVRGRPPPPRPRPTPAPRREVPPVAAPDPEPATERIPVVDIAALRREYNLD